jgi:hypothetical protein
MQDMDLKDIWKEFDYFSNINDIGNEYTEYAYNTHVLNPPKLNYKELITILDHSKLNSIGNDKYDLSEKWFKENPEKVKQLKNNIINYYTNIVKDKNKSLKCFWTTYLQYYSNIKGKGYTKGFWHKSVYRYEKKHNEWKDRIYLAYLRNDFIGVNQNCSLTQDQYALTSLLLFICKSGIREGKRITVYIPSKRMRSLLEEWIREQEYEE